MQSVNPLTQEVIDTYKTHSDKDINEIIRSSNDSFLSWKKRSIKQRADCFYSLSKILISKKITLAELITSEMGKVNHEAIAEIEKCAWACQYYAENTEEFLKDEIILTEANKSYVCYQPMGVILAVMPWNFPFWQVFRFAVPCMMAGNAALLKHSQNVTGCALVIEELFIEAGFPENIFKTIVVDNNGVQEIIEDPLIKAVTLTGGVTAGKSIASKAGEMLKKTVLELGGSDPYIILSDADIDLSVEKCVESRLKNTGQSCIAAKRFIVVKNIYHTWLEKFHIAMSKKTLGDPSIEGNHLGPMASVKLRDQLHKQVKDSISQGAKCLLGGEIPDLIGAFYPPTILMNVTKEMTAFKEELFGPVATVIQADNDRHAIELANDTEYGLGAAIFSNDVTTAENYAKYDIEAGACFINSFVSSDPRLPFGGIKNSGYGRELSSFGIKEFVNIKTVSMITIN